MLGGGEPAQSWALVGSVRRPFVTSESNVWIGSRSQGSMEIPTRSVQVRSTQPLRDVSAHCDPPWVTVRLSEIDGSDGEWTVELRSDKPLPPAGIFTGDVVLTAVTPTGKPVSVPVLKYATEMTHDVVARPNAIAVSSHETAGSIEHCLVLKSLSGQSFDVVDIESGIDTNVAVNRDSDSSEPHRHVYKLNLGGRFDRTRVKTLTFRISEHASGSTYPIPVEVTIVHGISGSAGNSFRSEP